MPLILRATVRFSPEKRVEFGQALDTFVPNLERTLGWAHRGLQWQADAPQCTLEWELASRSDLERARAFEQRPGEKPEWYARANAFVLGERLVLHEDDQETCVMDTLD